MANVIKKVQNEQEKTQAFLGLQLILYQLPPATPLLVFSHRESWSDLQTASSIRNTHVIPLLQQWARRPGSTCAHCHALLGKDKMWLCVSHTRLDLARAGIVRRAQVWAMLFCAHKACQAKARTGVDPTFAQARSFDLYGKPHLAWIPAPASVSVSPEQ